MSKSASNPSPEEAATEAKSPASTPQKLAIARLRTAKRPPFKLALLAEILMLRQGADMDPQAAVAKANEFWSAAEDFDQAAQQLSGLIEGLFSMTAREWKDRVRDYSGDVHYLYDLINGVIPVAPIFDLERDVLPQLFVAKNETYKSRLQKLGKLLEFAKDNIPTTLTFTNRLGLADTGIGKGNGYEPGGVPFVRSEQLVGRQLNMLGVRWLVETRQLQLSASKSHLR